MKDEEFFAKSNGETIEEHNQKLLIAFNNLKSKNLLIQWLNTDNEKIIRELIYFHDKGKINPEFQNRIRKILKLKYDNRKYNKIPHEWLSPAFISEEKEKEIKNTLNKLGLDPDQFFTYFIFIILSHHHRDYLPDDNKIINMINEIKTMYSLNIDYKYTPKYLLMTYNSSENRDLWNKYFPYRIRWLGLLYKCDYAASADIEPEISYNGNYNQTFNEWINKNRWSLKDFQIKANNNKDKSIILIASTGMGKTEAAMNWINGDKAFYLLGIRIAVNEMYKRFHKIFNDNVVLLHGESSIFYADLYDDDDEYESAVTKIRQLSYPITIATADQIITSVFKFPGFEIVYFTCSYSKIIIDEIQSFSPSSIAAIVVFLREIHSLGGKFMLMTATLPPFVQQELSSLKDVVVFDKQLMQFKRHRIKIISEDIMSEQSIEIIKNNMEKKILLICNTVRKAQNLYDYLSSYNINAKIIHSRFIGIHRKCKERQIMRSVAPCIWISTQIVEASLDIDFDLLLTECASIESLLQRFGRCFRKREYLLSNPNIYIFRSEPGNIYDPYLFNKTWEIIQKYDGSTLSEEEKQNIINRVFDNIENTKYYEDYKMQKELLELGYRTRTREDAERDFRQIINNYLVIPEKIYDLYEKKISNILEQLDDKDNKNKISREKLKSSLAEYYIPINIGRVYRKISYIKINSNFCKKNNIVIISNTDYNFEKGLSFTDIKSEENII